MPHKTDAAYLWDMLDSARTVLQITAGFDFPTYSANRTLQLAVERSIEIIGEAARNVSKAFQESHPEIPWRPIVVQRHVLAHDYGAIQQDRIWKVVTIHIPALVQMLDPIVKALSSSLPNASPPDLNN